MNDVTVLGESAGDSLELRLAGERRALFVDHRRGRSHEIGFDPGPWRFVMIEVRGRRFAFGRGRRRGRASRLLGVESLRDVADLESALRRLPAGLRGIVRHVVTENHRVQAAVGLLRAGEVGQLGGLLTASHISLRDHYRASTRRLDAAFEAAGRDGAAGARMTGGGLVALMRR